MNENGYSYVNQLPPPDAPAPTPLTWRDAAGPVLALGLSLLYWSVFGLDRMVVSLPGLGVPVFVAAYFAAVLVMTGGRLTRGGTALAAACLLLAASCAIHAHPGFTILNCFVILLLAAMATFSLSGQSRYCVLDARDIPESVRLSVLALLTRIDAPFRAAARLGKRDRDALWRALGTILGTLVLLAVVLALLASADMVFGSFFTGVKAWLAKAEPGTLLWRLARTVVLALFIASGLQFLREPAPATAERAERPAREKRALPFLTPVLALDVVYIIFCAIQLRYLFGGAQTAAMAGGWAEYARTGFFQLVAVAGIDLVLCLGGTDERRLAGRSGAALRLANALLLLLTAVILASAAYRMGLYIRAFGMSVLRIMTLWGMLVILAGLLLAGWKLVRPAFSFWRAFFPVLLAAWCLLSLAGPAARAADWNVDAYLAGRLERVDTEYLRRLGCDARPAAERLLDDDRYGGAARRLLADLQRDAEDAARHWSTRTWSER